VRRLRHRLHTTDQTRAGFAELNTID
jgi:hypothetical protein